MDRLALFKKTLIETQILQQRYPSLETLRSVINQIKYLIYLESNTYSDRGRLSEIILGVQVARELEPIDQNLADLLYKVDEESRKM